MTERHYVEIKLNTNPKLRQQYDPEEERASEIMLNLGEYLRKQIIETISKMKIEDFVHYLCHVTTYVENDESDINAFIAERVYY